MYGLDILRTRDRLLALLPHDAHLDSVAMYQTTVAISTKSIQHHLLYCERRIFFHADLAS